MAIIEFTVAVEVVDDAAYVRTVCGGAIIDVRSVRSTLDAARLGAMLTKPYCADMHESGVGVCLKPPKHSGQHDNGFGVIWT